MSRRHKRRDRVPEVKEIVQIAPFRRRSVSRRIENWILYGDSDGLDALNELFPIPIEKHQQIHGQGQPARPVDAKQPT